MHRRARRLASVHQGLKVRGIGVFGFSSNFEHDTHKRSAKSKSHAKSTPLCPTPAFFKRYKYFKRFSPPACACALSSHVGSVTNFITRCIMGWLKFSKFIMKLAYGEM